VRQALGYALSKGTLPVAASGNAGADGLYYPAAYPGVLAVGSAKLDGTRSDFSNYSTALRTWCWRRRGTEPETDPLVPGPRAELPLLPTLGAYAQWAGTSFCRPRGQALAALYVSQAYARYGTGGRLPTRSASA
jgi:serine protease